MPATQNASGPHCASTAQERRTQTALRQSKPGPHSGVCRQCFGTQRGWAPPLHSVPSPQSPGLAQPAVQLVAALHEQRTGPQISPFAQSVSAEQLPGSLKQVPQPSGVPGGAHDVALLQSG